MVYSKAVFHVPILGIFYHPQINIDGFLVGTFILDPGVLDPPSGRSEQEFLKSCGKLRMFYNPLHQRVVVMGLIGQSRQHLEAGTVGLEEVVRKGPSDVSWDVFGVSAHFFIFRI